MKYKYLIFMLVVSFYCSGQITVSDSSQIEKVTIQTTYGSLYFNKICKENILQFSLHLDFKNLDETVDLEAEKKNINDDKVFIQISIDESGAITKCTIVKRGKLESFNSYVEKVFEEIILEMKKSESYKLNCSNQKMVYTIPVNFRYN